MDRTKPVKIADHIYWVGVNIQESGLHCNPYLVVADDEAVLIDPGSPLDFHYVIENVKSVVPLSAIKYIILQHQDPDLCASTPLFENAGVNCSVCTHWRTAQLVKYYGIRSPFREVNQHSSTLEFQNGRVLQFIPTPYLHFPGAITTFDPATGTLFSSDLFGAYTHHWSLYADELVGINGKDRYIEAMKTFHEHYMPSNDVLRPVMEKLAQMDIRLIAPQHGSIIRKNVAAHIHELKILECGGLLQSIKKEVAKTAGLEMICNQILRRLFAVFPTAEIMEVFAGTDIVIDPETEQITDYSSTSQELWQNMFRLISSRQGWSWLTAIEPLTVKLVREYGIDMPDVFTSSLLEMQKESQVIFEENKALKEVNERLQQGLTRANDRLVKCPVTGLFNENMLIQYLQEELDTVLSTEGNGSLLLISIDDMSYLNTKYGTKEGDEMIRATAYTLTSLRQQTHRLFKIGGSAFAYYIASTNRETATKVAEGIRMAVANSTLTIEPLTVSIGVGFVNELEPDDTKKEHTMLAIAQNRMQKARKQGQNQVCAESSESEAMIRRGTVLIAEYEKINAEILINALEQEQYEVIVATDGDEAHRLISLEVPDFIIAELMLPKLDALLLKEKLRQTSTTQNIPFIILSYHKDSASVQRAVALGIEHYLQKPYFIDEVVGIVNNKISHLQKSYKRTGGSP